MDRDETSNKDAQVDYLSDYLGPMRGCGLLMEISAQESENLRMQFLVCGVRKSAMFHPIVGGNHANLMCSTSELFRIAQRLRFGNEQICTKYAQSRLHRCVPFLGDRLSPFQIQSAELK